jgi:hypothetical protein
MLVLPGWVDPMERKLCVGIHGVLGPPGIYGRYPVNNEPVPRVFDIRIVDFLTQQAMVQMFSPRHDYLRMVFATVTRVLAHDGLKAAMSPD